MTETEELLGQCRAASMHLGERLRSQPSVGHSGVLSKLCSLHSFAFQVWERLKKVRLKYWVAKIMLDAKQLGEPASRRRIYIVMIRKPPVYHKDLSLKSKGRRPHQHQDQRRLQRLLRGHDQSPQDYRGEETQNCSAVFSASSLPTPRRIVRTELMLAADSPYIKAMMDVLKSKAKADTKKPRNRKRVNMSVKHLS